MAVILLVLIGLIVLAAVSCFALYNSLVGMRNLVKNAWSQIDVQLKRRYDLIPNLVETAKGYMKHENETFVQVTEARAKAMAANSSSNVGEVSAAESQLGATLAKMLLTFENYPELKANQNFLALQEELASTENRIAFARQAYNDAVFGYNNRVEMFPSNIIAGMFNFTKADSFELKNEEERTSPQVKF